MQAAVEVTSRSMEHAGKQQIIATVHLEAQASCMQLSSNCTSCCTKVAKQNNAQV